MKEKIAAHDAGEKMLLEHKYLQSLRLITRGVSHEYNNIFTGLSGQFQLLNKEIKTDDNHHRALISELLERGCQKTSLLHDFSRYSSEKKELHSVIQAAEMAIEFLDTISNSHHFTLERGENLPRLQCSMKEITMAIFYLGENAIEAMPGGGTIRIVISTDTVQTGFLSIAVIDRGRGIAPDIEHDLFKPFISSKNSSAEVCGLGLYATHSIMQQHQGTVSISQDKDTVATISLPYEQGQEKQAPMPTPPLMQRDNQAKQIFFIIEDDNALRDFISTGLQRHGHIVFSAASCAEAVEEFKFVHEMITVILLDIGLNDCDGFSCLEKIVQIDMPKQIVFMSGGEITEKMKYGARFLQKPFTIKQIEELISHAE
ncbi:hybrid sensor histidine kinase/response regulator [Desulfotalea psychrophila]|uniref:histidine kinase n=1 Tax=Desulfotalea psychrophila (strain LSv54 / DSM 12343) TaxID=177439 RepID=Q6AR26_DESPS|nr:hybrid sensor histidine kinase/response regulator [Desulfotalea psychrophila]CAG35198.1 related to two-component system sensor histidine kinase (Cit family) [Desulfotalea psychrophila LSv54]